MNRTIVLGKDADDRECHSIEFNDLSENIRASVEFALPETVAYDCNVRLATWLLLILRKGSTHNRCHTKNRKEIGAYNIPSDPLHLHS